MNYSLFPHCSGSVYWPGSDCAGNQPTYTVPYEYFNFSSISYDSRVDQVLSWLDLPEQERPRLITLYLDGVDSAGHRSGPYSADVRNAIQQVDYAIGKLVAGVNARTDIAENIHYMVVSDHGMASIDNNRVIYLDDYLDLVNDVEIITLSPIASIRSLHGRTAQVYYQLQNIDHLQVYKKYQIPWEFHYSDNVRTTDIIAIADEGWSISYRNSPAVSGGNHGYDPSLPSMSSLFIGNGKFFKSDYTSVDKMSNIHIYILMCYILNIPPADNNGSWVQL